MIKKVTAAILLFLTLFADAASPIEYPRGYLLAYNNLADAATLRIAFKKIMNRYAHRYNIRLHLYYFTDPDEAVTSFEKSKIWTLGAMGRFWALDGKPLIRRSALCYISARQAGTPYSTFLLLGRREGSKHLRRGVRVTIPASRDNAQIYLQRYTLEHFGTLPEKIVSIRRRQNSRVTLYDLFFGQTDFAIVPAESLKLAEEMNPQIASQIRVIDRSPSVMIYAASCTSDKVPENLLNILRQANKEVKHSVEGREIIDMLQISRQWEADVSMFRPYIEYVLETEAMAKKAGAKR